jgi:hypothetical protein
MSARLSGRPRVCPGSAQDSGPRPRCTLRRIPSMNNRWQEVRHRVGEGQVETLLSQGIRVFFRAVPGRGSSTGVGEGSHTHPGPAPVQHAGILMGS